MTRLARPKSTLAGVVLIAALIGPSEGAATKLLGHPPPFVPQTFLFTPANGTSTEDLDRDGAIKTAKHIVEDLSSEERVDVGWNNAAVVKVEKRQMRVFQIWVVHFKSATDLGGQGSDLFIFMNQKGKFMKHSYTGR